ncbi:MAG TPA: PPC domain-containing DNA-binding protein [Planctomycetota bacterium]|nr:PPC domain-containing DNA-binding protein [Planctomycetota bacterium]
MRASLLLLLSLFLAGCAAPGAPGPGANLRVHALRLRPGQDVFDELQRFAKARRIEAGVVLTCAGSVRRAAIRFADRPAPAVLEGKREIVSLVGTVSASAGCHLHVALADGAGATIGGHLASGTLVYTTAEIAIGEIDDVTFERRPDPETTYRELVVTPREPR